MTEPKDEIHPSLLDEDQPPDEGSDPIREDDPNVREDPVVIDRKE